MHRFAPGPGTPDPVSLAIFAIDRVGPAAVRACASGVEVRAPHQQRPPVADDQRLGAGLGVAVVDPPAGGADPARRLAVTEVARLQRAAAGGAVARGHSGITERPSRLLACEP